MRKLLCCFLCLPVFISATDLSPWTGYDVELHPRVTPVVQKYPSHTNVLMGFGIEGSYDVWQVDFEVNVARTHKRELSLDDVRLTARYQLLNDILGDPVTLTAGLTLINTTRQTLHDPDLFHKGLVEGELHVAIGQEISCQEYWTTRVWGAGLLGIANRGFPWVRLIGAWEKNWWNQNELGVFADFLCGFGNKSFHPHHFHGYGSVHHQSLDVGVSYKIYWDCDVITLGYSYRVFANNYPKNVSTFLLNLMIPIGL